MAKAKTHRWSIANVENKGVRRVLFILYIPVVVITLFLVGVFKGILDGLGEASDHTLEIFEIIRRNW